LYESATTEALFKSMSENGSVAAVVTSEGGLLFGGHSMKPEGVVNALAWLNKAWDGSSISVRRVTTGSYDLENPRLTLSIAVQPEVIRQFMDKTQGLARSSGFAARFLITFPESTAGSRFYKEPSAMPRLIAFRQRIRELLNLPPTSDSTARPSIQLSSEAKALWIERYDAVEKSMGRGGELADMKDAAGKAAEQASRIATCFHVLEHDVVAEFLQVSEQHMAGAWEIVEWHLAEAKRFFAGMAQPEEIRNALRLDEWLIAKCRKDKVTEIPFNLILNKGPNPTRKKKVCELALSELVQRGRVRLTDENRRRMTAVNPALLTEPRP
jgi:putative DNA primase/helicase